MDTAPAAPLPQHWVEAVNPDGRPFYVHRLTNATQWERPVPVVSGLRPLPPGPPPYHSTPTRAQPQPQVKGGLGERPTRRIAFWAVTVLTFIVWTLGVVAGAEDDWIQGEDVSTGSSEMMSDCENNIANNGVCQRYVAFAVVQLAASIVVTICLAVFMIATFRPGSQGCCNTPDLGIAVGLLMTLYAICQVAAVMLIAFARSRDDYPGSKVGWTFELAMMASALAIIDAIAIFKFKPCTGDGPFYDFIKTYLIEYDVENNTRSKQQRRTPQNPPPPALPPVPAQQPTARSAS